MSEKYRQNHQDIRKKLDIAKAVFNSKPLKIVFYLV